jgi:hypothetical protein
VTRDGWLAASRQEYQQPFAGHSTSNGGLLAEKDIFRYTTAGRKFVSSARVNLTEEESAFSHRD